MEICINFWIRSPVVGADSHRPPSVVQASVSEAKELSTRKANVEDVNHTLMEITRELSQAAGQRSPISPHLLTLACFAAAHAIRTQSGGGRAEPDHGVALLGAPARQVDLEVWQDARREARSAVERAEYQHQPRKLRVDSGAR